MGKFPMLFQTSSTPFMTSPLVNDFGYLTLGPATQAVLDGTYVPPAGTDIYARKLFPHLKMDPAVAAAPPMKIVFLTDEHKQGWKKAREFTATGPSGLTFSHFIAATYDPMLASFDTTMANILYATGYSPKRWQAGTDVMIPKSAISLRVDKLRTILLLDPEFNQNNKILGRSLMSHAEAHSQIPQNSTAVGKSIVLSKPLSTKSSRRISGAKRNSPGLSAPTMPSPVMTGSCTPSPSSACFVSAAPSVPSCLCSLLSRSYNTSSGPPSEFPPSPSPEETFLSKASDKAMVPAPLAGQSSAPPLST